MQRVGSRQGRYLPMGKTVLLDLKCTLENLRRSPTCLATEELLMAVRFDVSLDLDLLECGRGVRTT